MVIIEKPKFQVNKFVDNIAWQKTSVGSKE